MANIYPFLLRIWKFLKIHCAILGQIYYFLFAQWGRFIFNVKNNHPCHSSIPNPFFMSSIKAFEEGDCVGWIESAYFEWLSHAPVAVDPVPVNVLSQKCQTGGKQPNGLGMPSIQTFWRTLSFFKFVWFFMELGYGTKEQITRSKTYLFGFHLGLGFRI